MILLTSEVLQEAEDLEKLKYTELVMTISVQIL